MGICIGVDFDTLYLTAACCDSGGFTLVQDSRDETRIPAALAITDHGLVFGWDALEWAQDWPERVIIAPARLLQYQSQGQTSSTVRRFLDGFAVTFELLPDGQLIIHLGPQSYPSQRACACLLGELKRLAEKRFGDGVDTCVVTVPTYTNVAYVEALKAATYEAGFSSVYTLSQSRAIVFYKLDRLPADKYTLFFVAGGSSCQATVIRTGKDCAALESLAEESYPRMGAWQADQELFRWACSQLEIPRTARTAFDMIQLARLRREVQKAREELGRCTTALIHLDGSTLEMTRECLKQVLDVSSASRVQLLIDDTLQEADLPEKAIDHIVLAGELSDMSWLGDLLRCRFDRATVEVLDDREAAAKGAASWWYWQYSGDTIPWRPPSLDSFREDGHVWSGSSATDYVTIKRRFGISGCPPELVRLFHEIEQGLLRIEIVYQVVTAIASVMCSSSVSTKDELELLAFGLGINPDNLEGDALVRKATDLALKAYQTSRLWALVVSAGSGKPGFWYGLQKKVLELEILQLRQDEGDYYG